VRYGDSVGNTTASSPRYSSARTDLYLSNLWRQYESSVISVHHHYNADGSRREPPGVLVRIAHLPRFWVLERDVKHLGKVLAEVMRRCCLQ